MSALAAIVVATLIALPAGILVERYRPGGTNANRRHRTVAGCAYRAHIAQTADDHR